MAKKIRSVCFEDNILLCFLRHTTPCASLAMWSTTWSWNWSLTMMTRSISSANTTSQSYRQKEHSWILIFWIILISNNETHRSLLQCGSTKARERTSSATTTIMFMTTQGCKNTSSLLGDNLISSQVPLTDCSWHVQCTLHIHVSWGTRLHDTMMIAHTFNFQNPK